MNGKKAKELGWIASSKKDLMEFPREVRKEMAHALYVAQLAKRKRGNQMAKKKQIHEEEIECEMSSGNVFADIGIENPDEELTKAKLVWEIEQIIKKKKLTQAKAASIMGINQPKVSALILRKLDGFSVERLIHFLNTLGQDIDIVVRPKPANRKQARINVYHDNGYGNSTAIPIVAKGCSVT